MAEERAALAASVQSPPGPGTAPRPGDAPPAPTGSNGGLPAGGAGEPSARPGSGASVRPARQVFHPLEVVSVERLCEDAAALGFAVPEHLAEDYRFRAGQSVTLRRHLDGREERRSYSICAPESAPLRIGVRAVPGGALSPWLVGEVTPGDRIEVAPPSGSFTPDLERPGRHVLVGAGSGITPLLSIAASVLARPQGSVALLYGNRSSSTVMFAEELADLKDAHTGRFELFHVLSREPQEVEVSSGRLEPARLAELFALLGPEPVEHWWLCGPYGLVVAASGLLARMGVEASRVHRELFYVEDEAPEPHRRAEEPPGSGASVTVVLDGRTTTAVVPAGVSILEGVQRVRADVPFACKGGVCGTCRARLRSGEVRMRRTFALEAEEIAAGVVLTCQAVPASEQLVVDYDT